MKMIVNRPEKVEYTDVDVEYIRKPGKGLGLSLVAMKCGKGVFIGDIVSFKNLRFIGNCSLLKFNRSVSTNHTY